MKKKTLYDAQNLLSGRVTDGYEKNKKFRDGDHWQDGDGYPAMPPVEAENRATIVEKIKEAFCGENTIGTIIEDHLDGIVAREPDWDLVDTTAVESDDTDTDPAVVDEVRTEAINALVAWWNSRQMLETLREALSLTLIQERCVIRAYVPPGFVDESGNIEKQKNLAAALEMLQFEVLPANVAGVFRDEERFEPFGIFVNTGDGMNRAVELTYLDENGMTCLRLLENETLRQFTQKTLPQIAAYIPDDAENADGDGDVLPEIEPINLNRNLLMFEMRRKPLIDEQIRTLQKHLNLTWTMGGKNTVTGGSRERYFSNTQKPRKPVIKQGTNGSQVKTYEKANVQIGGQFANFLEGQPIYEGVGEQRKIIGYADASVTVVDPVDSSNFDSRRDKIVFAMRCSAQQGHIQMNDMADVSGKSKQEGRAGFEKSLKRSKTPVDAAGRWIIEVGLRFAAAFTTAGNGQTTREKDFEKYRIDFNSIVDAGAIDPEQTKDDKADVEAGLMSPEAYLSRRGFEDPDAETARTKKSEFYRLARRKKQLEVAQLAKTLGFPSEEILILAEYDEEERERLLPLMTAGEGEGEGDDDNDDGGGGGGE